MLSPGACAAEGRPERAERLEALRELLRQRDVLPVEAPRRALPSGWAALDALLPGGGFPRGGLSEVLGALGSGKLEVMARAVAALLVRGAPVAWVSGRGPLYAPALRGLALPPQSLLQICPADPARAGWAAEQVLRSDTFDLVLLDAVHPSGRPALDEAGFRRLAGAARGFGGAVVMLCEPSEGRRAGARSPEARHSDPPLQRGCPISVDLRLAVRPFPGSQVPAVPSVGVPPARTISTVRRNRRVEVTLLHGRGLPPGRHVVLEL